MPNFKQIILVVLDGFGVASHSEGNSISLAEPENINYLVNNYPAAPLQASGPSVGLPWGERGNSEVGHLNLGAGRIVSQDLPRINQSISSGEFYENPMLLGATEHVKKNGSKLHFVGLVSPGGVHSSEEHLFALLELAREQKVEKVFVHMFTDGRDTQPKVALDSLDRLTRKFLEAGRGKVASLIGRFYAMDRAGHWEITEATYKALVLGEGEKTSSAREAIMSYYQKQIFDETIPPTVIVGAEGPVGRVTDDDAVIFFNFRPDRARQLVRAFVAPDFDKFSQKHPPLQNMYYATMTQYERNLSVSVVFPPIEIDKGLSEVISLQKLTQFHIAESEKYAHVTSFFNGGKEEPWLGEEREIITSPATYQKRYQDVPEMSVEKVQERVVEKIKAGVNFILVNIANPDMVGHTANRKACVQAIKAVDRSIGKIHSAVMEHGACLIVTADHGNIEQVLDLRTGQPDKEHSLNPVPLIVIGKGLELGIPRENGYLELSSMVPEGLLSDVSPTILELMGLPKPPEMTAISLMPILFKQMHAENLESKD